MVEISHVCGSRLYLNFKAHVRFVPLHIQVKKLIVSVINFTAVLIEHSYARHIYNSTEHLCTLLGSPDLDVVLVVLNLLYVFGKRSNFISRLPSQQRNTLNSFLEYLGEV